MKRKNAAIGRGLCVFALLLAVGTPAIGQEDARLRKELDALRQGQEAIQKDMAIERQIGELRKGQEAIQRQLDEIKRLLETRTVAAAPGARPDGSNVADLVLDLGDNPTKGRSDAPLTLIEFTDYQCSYCAVFAKDTLPQLTEEFVKTGKVRLALLDLPLESIHPKAFKAAEASHCAAEQGKFWEMHDRLFANQKEIDAWSGHAKAVGLDASKFESCLSSGKYADGIRRDMAQAQRAGANGTPSFVLTRTDTNDKTKVKGITALRGAQGFNAFKAAIDSALGGTK